MRVLITGGAGAFGSAFVHRLMGEMSAIYPRIAVYSRDEHKHERLHHEIGGDPDDRMRWFLGDVRDVDRLTRALHDIDVIVHAAALKIVPTLEYNPTEAIKTNVLGAMNVIDAALRSHSVKHVVALSTDKACAPVNLYGATKLAAEKSFLAANAYSGGRVRFNVVRYGNIAGSTGSVIPRWRALLAMKQPLLLTHARMTRFWMTLEQAVELVRWTTEQDFAGRVVIPKLPTYSILDLAKAVCAESDAEELMQVTGMRAGEKMHESLISGDESWWVRDDGGHYIISPFAAARDTGGWSYTSDTGLPRLSPGELLEELRRVP